MNKAKRLPRRRDGEETSGASGLLKHAVAGAAIAAMLALILLLISTAVTLSFDDPTRLSLPLSVFIFCVSFVACGFIAARTQGDTSLPAGLLSGAILDIFILAVAFIIGHDGMLIPSLIRALLFLAAIPLSVLGAYLGSIKPTRKRRTTIRR